MFKGEYKTKTAQGTPITYMIGDSVVYQGKVYTAVNQTQKSPLQSPKDWKYTGLTEPVQGSSSPLLPEENQFWVDQSNNLYIRKDFTNAVWQQVSGGSGSGGAGISGPYVISFNGLTGAVTGVTTGVANTFIPLQTFAAGISAAGATFGSVVNIGNSAEITTVFLRGLVNFINCPNGFLSISTGQTLAGLNIEDASGNNTTIKPTPHEIVFYDDSDGDTVTLNAGLVVGSGPYTVALPSYGTTLAGLAGEQTFTGLKSFSAGISASGGTFSGNISAPNIVNSLKGWFFL